jgi:addiction module HigA family antidote
MPMKNPPHPGDLIRTEIIDALGLSVSRAAEILKVRRATLSDLLHGKAALTPEMALRIEKAFGPDMNHLLRMQLAYDVAKMRAQAGGRWRQAVCAGQRKIGHRCHTDTTQIKP